MPSTDLLHSHDPEMEACFLGSVVADPESLNESWSHLPDEVFYVESNRQFWRHVRRIHSETGGVDLPLVMSRMREADQTAHAHTALASILGVEFGEYTPKAFYAPEYADRLKAFYVRREKARSVRKYEQTIKDNPDAAGEARLELELMLHVLDTMINEDPERSDEDIAREMGPEGKFQTGFPDLDRLTGGFAKPGLNVVAARPSVGKSAFARTVIRKASARGQSVLWYSKDQSINQIFELEMARALQIDTNAIRGLPLERRVAGIKHVREEVWHQNVTLIDRPIPLAQLLTTARTERPDLVVIDYIQIVDTGIDDEYESITATSKALKTLAFQLRAPILALAQFNRQHQSGKPSMSNLRGSGQLEQDADQIMALDRDTTLHTSEPQQATLQVLKNKTGGAGSINLAWVGKYAHYDSHAAPRFEAEAYGGRYS